MTISAFIWLMAWVRALTAESLTTFSIRIISTLSRPDFGIIPGYSREDRPRCHLSIYRVALTQPAARGPVGPVDLDDDPDHVWLGILSQSGSVGARAFDSEGNYIS